MPRPKGSTNKITTDVKGQLHNLIDEVINSIDINSMDTSQKLKLLQLSLHYVIPKLRSITDTTQESEDLPFILDIHLRDGNNDWITEHIETKLPSDLVKKNRDKWS